MTLRLF